MKIAVYSGSFNPLHIGHKAIMEYLTNESGFNWVYLVVSPKNPLKDNIEAKTGEDRYEAAVAAVKRHPEVRVWVDDIELHMDPPHYTIRTLDALRDREPGNTFVLVIGADNLTSFNKWKDYSRILLEYGVCVYPREGYDLESARKALLAENQDYKISVVNAPEVTVSSTEIREKLAAGIDVSDKLM